MDTKKLQDAEPQEVSDELDEELEESGVWTYHLRKPATYNGETYEELHFDFESLSGRKIMQITHELQRLGLGIITAPEFNMDFQLRVAMHACKEPVGSDFFDTLDGKDFIRIIGRARNFLLVQA